MELIYLILILIGIVYCAFKSLRAHSTYKAGDTKEAVYLNTDAIVTGIQVLILIGLMK